VTASNEHVAIASGVHGRSCTASLPAASRSPLRQPASGDSFTGRVNPYPWSQS
jgi:hypothetical protein